jgi:hypothetical protein
MKTTVRELKDALMPSSTCPVVHAQSSCKVSLHGGIFNLRFRMADLDIAGLWFRMGGIGSELIVEQAYENSHVV